MTGTLQSFWDLCGIHRSQGHHNPQGCQGLCERGLRQGARLRVGLGEAPIGSWQRAAGHKGRVNFCVHRCKQERSGRDEGMSPRN